VTTTILDESWQIGPEKLDLGPYEEPQIRGSKTSRC
jgi:hypothetical protein